MFVVVVVGFFGGACVRACVRVCVCLFFSVTCVFQIWSHGRT